VTRLLAVREVAEALAVSRSTVLRWTREGVLPGFRLPSGALRYREDDLAAWIERRATPSEEIANRLHATPPER